jgi:hypothetical protein
VGLGLLLPFVLLCVFGYLCWEALDQGSFPEGSMDHFWDLEGRATLWFRRL